MNFLNKINKHHINFILTLSAVSSVIIGFFTGHVTSEVFYTTVGGIISHFYQGNRISELENTIEAQSIKLQSITGG